MRTLRVLGILTKRQMADDGPLLVGAFLGAVLFCLALGAIAFIYPQGFLLHVVAVLVVLPVLVGMGSFVLGLVQVRGDEHRGIPAMLSGLSVTPSQVILARLVTGMVFVVVVVVIVMLAITGAILSGLVQWPESLVPGGLVDLLVALLLMGLACYDVGALADRGAAGRLAPLGILPLVLALISLIAIKGFAGPLAIVLVPFVVASSVCLPASVRCSRLGTITLGVLVVVMIAVPLYWLRFCSDTVMGLVTLETSGTATLHLYREFPPLADSYSGGELTIQAELHSDAFPLDQRRVHSLLRPLGIMTYLQAKEPRGNPVDWGHFGNYWGFYYDDRKGLFAQRSGRGTLYAGPEGVADNPTKDLGHFLSPIVYGMRQSRPITRGGQNDYSYTIFDGQSRCFYAINFEERDVYQRLRLIDSAFRPVDPRRSALGSRIWSIDCRYPSLRGKEAQYAQDDTRDYLPVVDESGAVAVIDQKAWRLSPNAGHLPRPRTFFGRASSKPRDLFAYDTAVLVKRPENEYAGLITASVSRQGTRATVAVFNKEGRLIQESQRGARFDPALLFTAKYLVESMHPPVLTLASLFTAYSFEAGATHRALFLMPNSFVALQRDRETGFIFQLLMALVFLLPALLFAGFLSWRVVRDAAAMGLSRNARWLWGMGTLAFGLPAYITYRLTRPRVALALCRDCEQGRRVDQEVCHHCGSGWNVPVLEPPAWRVISP